MRKFQSDQVPKLDSKGANHRARQLVYQIPKQDFNTKYAQFLEDAKSQKSFDELRRRMIRDAIGVGKLNTIVSKYKKKKAKFLKI